jgi:hypothetical protein
MSEHNRPIASRKRAQILSTTLFLIGLAILSFTGVFWPGIMLITGLSVALRQFLLGRRYDMMVTLLVFIGTFITVQFDISWQVFLPTLFSIGAIYLLFKEFCSPDETTEEEKEEELNCEIKEDKN